MCCYVKLLKFSHSLSLSLSLSYLPQFTLQHSYLGWLVSLQLLVEAIKMAQLPPKIPTMTPNWPPAFPHQRIPQLVANLFIPTTTAQSPPQPPPPSSASSCWVDEFLDFSSARRGSHRRSISDSIAYLEAPLLECRNLNSHHSTVATSIMHGNETSFDRLDDEQLMSMFSDDMTVTVPPTLSTSNPSTPSDQNSNNDEIKPCVQDQQHQQHQPKNEPGEVDSSSNSDPQATQNSAGGGGGGSAANGDTFLDPKRVKRILANRQSAQRSRVRKLQYISELERSVTSLQTEVSALSPRVAFLDHQRLILNVDNSALKQRIAALAQDKIFKDAHQDALKKEIERLRQIYHQQNLKKMNNNNNNNNAPPPSPLSSQKQQQQQPPPGSDNMDCTDKEQLLN